MATPVNVNANNNNIVAPPTAGFNLNQMMMQQQQKQQQIIHQVSVVANQPKKVIAGVSRPLPQMSHFTVAAQTAPPTQQPQQQQQQQVDLEEQPALFAVCFSKGNSTPRDTQLLTVRC